MSPNGPHDTDDSTPSDQQAQSSDSESSQLDNTLPLWPDDLMAKAPRTPETDCFRPPKVNCVVRCLHCNECYDSYRIEWREIIQEDGSKEGFWRCPTPGCDGAGFLFDIHPVDAHWQDDEDRGMTGGWFNDDGTPTTLEELERLDRESRDDEDGSPT